MHLETWQEGAVVTMDFGDGESMEMELSEPGGNYLDYEMRVVDCILTAPPNIDARSLACGQCVLLPFIGHNNAVPYKSGDDKWPWNFVAKCHK